VGAKYSYNRVSWVSIGPLTSNGAVTCPGLPQRSQPYSTTNYPGIFQMYSYDSGGGLSVVATCVGSLAGCGYVNQSSDSYGRVAYESLAIGMKAQGSYPSGFSCLSWTYDTMGRPASLTDLGTGSQCPATYSAYSSYSTVVPLPWVQNVQYDVANRVSSMALYSGPNANPTTQTQAWNVMGQLKSIQWNRPASGSDPGMTGGLQYVYSASQNNGQAQQAIDTLFGENVTYQYDSLRRLTSAVASPIAGSQAPAWTQSFQYDGFGNFTAKILNGQTTSVAADPATNRLTGSLYDANGNMLTGGGNTFTYDAENRIVSASSPNGGVEHYAYGPGNKRTVRQLADGTYDVTIYGVRGEAVGSFAWSPSVGLQLKRVNVWFGGRLIGQTDATLGPCRRVSCSQIG
jgi:YD repeat-containing protein